MSDQAEVSSEKEQVDALIQDEDASNVARVDEPEEKGDSLTGGPDLITQRRLATPVLVSDRIPVRQRRFEDVVEAIAALFGIAFVVLVNIYASSTTQGVEKDITNALGEVLKQVLFLPLSVLEGLFVIAAPLALMISLLRRGELASVIKTVITGVVSALLAWGLLLLIPVLPSVVSAAFVVETSTGQLNSVNGVFVVIIAMLTIAGTSNSSTAIRLSWWGIWILLFFSLVRGTETLPGILITVLLGRLFGSVARWTAGFDDGRAGPANLVDACLDVGLTPMRIVRSDLNTSDEPLETWEVSESDQTPDFRRGQINPPLKAVTAETPQTSFHITPQFNQGRGRLYQIWLTDGLQLDLHVSDPEVSLVALAVDIWENIRLKGISRWISTGLKPSVERSMLTAASAASAGVRTPRPLALAEAGSSVAVVWETLPPVASLFDLVDNGVEVSDDMLDQAWRQLQDAHDRGICHRDLERDSIRVDSAMNVWIVDWSQGDLGSGGTARMIDCAQMLVHLSLVSTPERAIASAQRQIGPAKLLSTGLVLQSAVLPSDIRPMIRRTGVLDTLRDQLSQIAPTAQAPEPMKVQRFAPRTVLMAVLGAAALVAVFGGLNFNAVVDAVKQANPWLIFVAFAFGCLPWLGAAIPLVAFSPKKIGLWETTLSQMAGSIVALVAPAGIGPAAASLRFLNKQKIATPVAVATVTLVQVSQFLTSVILLIVVVVATGTSLNLNLPTTTIIWVFAAVVTVLAAAFAIPTVRHWIIATVEPYWNQAYPQLLWILGHPKELGIAFLGNLLMNIGYIAAFGFSLAAFGMHLNVVTLSITYLISTTIGSLVPSPGGIGPVEAALTAGLQVAGIPAAVALSTAVVFRLVSFYGRLPIGWLALRHCEKKGLL